MSPEPLSTGEFTRSMDRLHDRFDSVDRRVNYCVSEVAGIKATLHERAKVEKKQTRNSASGWAAVVTALVVGIFKAIDVWAK